jgi:hypothetical protein
VKSGIRFHANVKLDAADDGPQTLCGSVFSSSKPGTCPLILYCETLNRFGAEGRVESAVVTKLLTEMLPVGLLSPRFPSDVMVDEVVRNA